MSCADDHYERIRQDEIDEAPEKRIARGLLKAAHRARVDALMAAGMDRATAHQVAAIDSNFDRVFGERPENPSIWHDDSRACSECGGRTNRAVRCDRCESLYQTEQRFNRTV